MATIDERVVEMRFDNRDFERNVSTSLGTIDKLKKSLDFKDAGRSLEDLQRSANQFSVDNVTNQLVALNNNKLDWADIFKISLLNNVVNEAVSIVKNAAERIKSELHLNYIDGWANASLGFEKYAEKTQAVATIMGATGKSIDEVNEKMDRLNYFTDETSYDFADMANNIGKFTAAGVDLEDATVAMEGISTWAARSGQDKSAAARVMYNLSQAIGLGNLKVIDWKSVELANMATKEFKEQLIATGLEYKTLVTNSKGMVVVKNGMEETADAVEVTAEHLRDTLNENWVDKDVLVATLNEYGKAAELIADIHDVTGLYAKEIIDLADANKKGALTEKMLADALGIKEEHIAANIDSINALKSAIQLLSGDEYEFSLETYKAAQEARTFEQAMLSAQDAVSTAWMNVFENIFGNYEKAKELWSDLAENLFDAFTWLPKEINKVLIDANYNGWKGFNDGLQNAGLSVDQLKGSLIDMLGLQGFRALLGDAKDFEEALKKGYISAELINMVFDHTIGTTKTVNSMLKLLSQNRYDNFEVLAGSLTSIGYSVDDVVVALAEVSNEPGLVQKIEEAGGLKAALEQGIVTVEQLAQALDSLLGSDVATTLMNIFQRDQKSGITAFDQALKESGHSMDELEQALKKLYGDKYNFDGLIEQAGGLSQAIQKGIIPINILEQALKNLGIPAGEVGKEVSKQVDVAKDKFEQLSDLAEQVRAGKFVSEQGTAGQIKMIAKAAGITEEEAALVVKLAEEQHKKHRKLTMEEVKQLKLWKEIEKTCGKVTENVAEGASASEELTDEQREQLKALYEQMYRVSAQESFIEGLMNIGHTFVAVLDQIHAALLEVFPPITGERLSELAMNFKDTTERIREFVENTDVIKQIAKTLLLPFRLLADLISFAVRLIPSLISLVSLLAAPFIFVISKIGEFVSAIQEANGEASPFAATLIKVADAISTVINFVVEVLKYVGEIVKNRFVEKFSTTFYGLIGAIKQFKADKLKAIDEFIERIKNADVEAAGDKIISGLLKIWHFTEPIRKALKTIYHGFQYIGKAVKDFKSRLSTLNKIPGLTNLQRILYALEGTFRKSLKVIKEKFKALGIDVGDLETKFTNFLNLITEKFEKVKNVIEKVKTFLGDIKHIFVSTFNSFGENTDLSFYERVWESIKAAAIYAFERIKEKVKSVLADMGIDVDDLKEKFENFWSGITDKVDKIKSKLEKVVNFIKELKNVFIDTYRWLGDDTELSTFERIWESVKKTAEYAFDRIKAKIKQMLADAGIDIDDLKAKFENFFNGISEKAEKIKAKFNKVINFIEELKAVFVDTYRWLGDDTELSTFERIWESVKKTAEYAFDRIKAKIKQTLADAGFDIDNFKAKFDKLKTIVSVIFAPILAVISAVGWAIGKVAGLFSDAYSKIADSEELTTLQKVWTSVLSVFETIKEKIKGIFTGEIEIPEKLKVITDKLTKVKDLIVEIFNNVKDSLKLKFDEFFGKTDENGEKLSKITIIFDAIKNAAKTAWDTIVNFFKGLGFDTTGIGEKLGSIKDMLISSLGLEDKDFESMFGGFKDKLPKILAVGGAIAGGLGVIKLLKGIFGLKKEGLGGILQKGLSGALEKVGLSLVPFGEGLEKTKGAVRGFNILAFAGAIGILAFSLAKIATIPADQVGSVLKTMGIALLGFLGYIIAAKQIIGNDFNMFGAGMGLLAAAGALYLFGKTLETYQQLDLSEGGWSKIIKILLMAVISLSMIAKKVGKFNFRLRNGLGLIAAVGALWLFGKVLEQYSNLQINSGFGKIVEYMLVAILALRMLAKAAGKNNFTLGKGMALIAAAGALYILGLTLEKIGKIERNVLIQGGIVLVILSILLTTMAYVLMKASKDFSLGKGVGIFLMLGAIVGALYAFALLIGLLGKIPTTVLDHGAKALVQLGIVLLAMSALMMKATQLSGFKHMLGATALLGAIVLALVAFGAILILFSIIPSNFWYKGLNRLIQVLILILAAFAVTSIFSGFINLKGVFGALAAFGILILELLGAIYVLKKLESISYDKIKDNFKCLTILLGCFAVFLAAGTGIGVLGKFVGKKNMFFGMATTVGMFAVFILGLIALVDIMERMQNLNATAITAAMEPLEKIALFFAGFVGLGTALGILTAIAPIILVGMAVIEGVFLVFLWDLNKLIDAMERLADMDAASAEAGITAVDHLLTLMIGLANRVNSEGGGFWGAIESSVEAWAFGKGLDPLVHDAEILGLVDTEGAINALGAVDALLDYMIGLRQKFDDNSVSFTSALNTSATAWVFGQGLDPLAHDALILGLTDAANAEAALGVVDKCVDTMISLGKKFNQNSITFGSAIATSGIAIGFGVGLAGLAGAEWLMGLVNVKAAEKSFEIISKMIDKMIEVATKFSENESLFTAAKQANSSIRGFAFALSLMIGAEWFASLVDYDENAEKTMAGAFNIIDKLIECAGKFKDESIQKGAKALVSRLKGFAFALAELIGAEYLATLVDYNKDNGESTMQGAFTIIDKLIESAGKFTDESIQKGAKALVQRLKRFAWALAELILDTKLAEIIETDKSTEGLKPAEEIINFFIGSAQKVADGKISGSIMLLSKALTVFGLGLLEIIGATYAAQWIDSTASTEGLKPAEEIITFFVNQAKTFKEAGITTEAMSAAESFGVFGLALIPILAETFAAEWIDKDQSTEGLEPAKDIISFFVEEVKELKRIGGVKQAEQVANSLYTFAGALIKFTAVNWIAKFEDPQAALAAIEPVHEEITLLVDTAKVFKDNPGIFEAAQDASEAASKFADTLKDIGGANKKLSKTDADETLKALGPVKEIVGILIYMATSFVSRIGMAEQAAHASEILGTFGENVATFASKIGSTGVWTHWDETKANLVSSIFSAFAEGIIKLVDVKSDISSVGDALSGIGEILTYLDTYWDLEDMEENLGGLTTIFTSIETAMSQFNPEFKTAGAETIQQFIDGITGMAFNAGKAAGDVAYTAYKWAKVYESSFYTAGLNMAEGLAQGIADGSIDVIRVTKEMCENAAQTARNVFDENSPSRVFAQIGNYISQGLANGITEDSVYTEQAITNMSQNLIDSTMLAINNLEAYMAAGDFSPTITPVIDLSNAQSASRSLAGTLAPLNLNGGKYQVDGELIERGTSTRSIVNEIQSLNDKLALLGEHLDNMQIVLDSGVLVGATSAQMDAQFGIMNMRAGRGN